MRIVSDFFDALLDTEEFFRRIRERRNGDTLLYFGTISLISLAINWILLWNGITPAGIAPFQKILTGERIVFLLPALYFFAGFVLTGIFALLLGRVLRTMRVPVTSGEVLKAAMYGFTPSLLTLWIPVLGLLFLVWSVYLTAMGLEVYNGAGLRKNAQACLLAGAVMAVATLLLLFGIGLFLISALGKNPALLWTVILF